MEKGISLTHVFQVLRKKAGWIIGLSVTGLLIAWMVTRYAVTPQYTSNTKILVNYTQASDIIQQSDIDINLQMINTYKDIIENPIILDDVREELNLTIGNGELSQKMEITSKENSQVFAVQVTDEDPVQAAAIANTIATTFQENINEIMNVENVTIISKAVPFTEPVSPNVLLNLAVGFLLGFLLSIGKIFFDEYTDNSIKTEEFVTEELGWLSLGQVNELTAEELSTQTRTQAAGAMEREGSSRRAGLKSRV
ncbi:YveK family protein [Atopococcus tabaci]|uniref:YveK family protein n=1 Tax=Atopococcus tabaci TaxID=269774 RepID=UPI0003F5A636|nr:Wzz/FepE/Etk N-terminal domain-containing protein [Atopococcus tabaci]